MATHFITASQASVLRDRELVVDSSFIGNGQHAGKIRMSIKHGPTGSILCQGYGAGDQNAFEDAWSRLPNSNGIANETEELRAKVEELQKQLADKQPEKTSKANGKPVTNTTS